MKEKIIKRIIIALLLIGISIPIAISAATRYPTSQMVGAEWISGIYINKERPTGGTAYQQAEFLRRTVDWQFVYCIQPGVALNETDAYPGYYENQAVVAGMTEAKWDRVTLLAYYGYQFNENGYDHSANKWYAVTQVLIWRTVAADLGWNIYFTNTLNGTRNDSLFASEIAEIESLIANHYKVPSFDKANYRIPIGSKITLTDTNNILNTFNVSSNSVIGTTVSGNQLTVTANKVGITTLTLNKTETKLDIPPVVYVRDDGQNVMTRGSWDPIYARVNIEVYGGTIELEKVDRETGLKIPQGSEAKLDGAIYEMRAYENILDTNGEILIAKGTLVDTLTTTTTSIKSKEVPLGKYILKEISSSYGYLLDDQEYIVNITEGSLNVKFTAKEQIVKSKIELMKSYSQIETGHLLPEENITFDIYNNKGQLVTSITSDKNGFATVELIFGHYTFKQKNSLSTHEKVEDFEVIVDYDTNGKTLRYNLVNKMYEARVKIIKVDEETGNKIPDGEISFKILNIDTGKYVEQKILFPTPMTLTTFATKNGELVTPLMLPAGNYKIEEIKIEDLIGYYINQDSLFFTIDENSNFIKDDVYEILVEMKFPNKLVKGKVEIIKIGEVLVIEDNTYRYEKIKLNNTVFELFAGEDIISVNGKLRYNKGDLVATLTTDETGFTSLDNLWLGRYCLVEISNDYNNHIESKPNCFTLTYKDQDTSIVIKTEEISNKYKIGTLEFTKTDLTTGKVIPNVIMEIYTEDNELIFTGKTDETGKIVITDLPVGKKFYLVEKEALTGYKINDEKIFFELLENGEIVKASMTNEKFKGILDFTKIDFSTGEPIPNTLIEVYDEFENLIFSGRTDENGKIVIENLEYGKYYILERETADPKYRLNTDKMWFEITKDGEIVKATMENEIIEVPNTEKNDYTIYISMSFVILGGSALIYVKKRNRKK